MPSKKTFSWDIFCKVIDNFGDIGVCLRLARQLRDEYQATIRLWVDDLKTLQKLCPDVNIALKEQTVEGILMVRWNQNEEEHLAGNLPSLPFSFSPNAIVLETFSCHVPPAFLAKMAAQKKPPVWLNLDYLSAEKWVDNCHQLPSPHPKYALKSYFFYPGFSEKTGGLLREKSIKTRQKNFTKKARAALLLSFGVANVDNMGLLISLFSYDNKALRVLLDSWAKGVSKITCLICVHAPSKARTRIEKWAGKSLKEGESLTKGALTLIAIPFVSQEKYDEILWACDLNFVRGEDSFVRGQWAKKPMIWQVYPQEESTHIVKLKAFLDIYCADWDADHIEKYQQFCLGWNAGKLRKYDWQNYFSLFKNHQKNAQKWAKKQAKTSDLCAQLVQFIKSKL